MKVVLFNSEKTWGGGEKWYADAAKILNENNQQVYLFTGKQTALYHKTSHTSITTIPVKTTNVTFIIPWKVIWLSIKLRKINPDAIVINLSKDLKYAGLAARMAGVPKIIYRRGSAKPIHNTWLNRLIMKHLVTTIIANSQQTKNTVLQNNPNLFPSDKIHVVYNGIETFQYTIKPKKFNNAHIRLGNAGRLSPEKGHDRLLRAVAEVNAKNYPFKLSIAGDGPLLHELEKQTCKLNIAEHVQFVGFKNDLNTFFDDIDIFILPSYYEGFGYVVIEAMHYGIPVIAFNIGTTTEIIDDGINGFILENGDIFGMAEKIIYLAEHPEIRKKFGDKAREKVTNQFSLHTMFIKLMEILNSK